MPQKNLSRFAFGMALAIVASSTLPAKVNAFNQLIVFGDSLSDQGNFLPLTGNTFPNSPFFFAGRFSNGLIWTDYLAAQLGIQSNVINYAFGGATTGNNTVSPIPGALGLKQEIDAFKQQKDVFGRPIALASDPLYILWAGANDYLVNDYAQTIDNLSNDLSFLASIGAKNIVVPNLPDLSITPLLSQAPDLVKQQFNGLIQAHNSSLDSILDSLSATFPKTNFIRFDSYDFFNTSLLNRAACTKTNLYAASPFPDPSNLYNPGCNGDLDTQNSFLFWDSVHPNTYFHKLIADSVVALLPDQPVSVPERTSPVSLLIVGIGAIALVTLKRRRNEADKMIKSHRKFPLA